MKIVNNQITNRCSRRRYSVKKCVTFTGKHLCWSRPPTYKKDIPTWVLSHEYSKIFKNTFFEEHLRTTGSVHKARKNCICFRLHAQKN